MKALSDLLHRTPWWLLLGMGFAMLVGLAVFVTPTNLMRLEASGRSVEQKRAIKREVDVAFSDSAIRMARGIVAEMREHAKDPARRAELDRALAEIDRARAGMRDAGAQAREARREAERNAAEAVKEASTAIARAKREVDEARRQVERASKHAPDEAVRRSLDESAAATKQAGEEARRAVDAVKSAGEGATPATAPPPDASGDATRPAIVIAGTGDDVDVHVGEATPLPPEMREDIHRKVTRDIYRIGLGAGLILLFVPLFILTVVAKLFIDRSRAAQRMAELKRKEAEFHRMSRQVTEAKLSALQAQVEPHFLYNTLASVQALTEVDPKQAAAMTGHLIQYLRNALPKMRESSSTLGQEVELVRAYLNILQMRMGRRLAFSIDVPAELAALPFPPLMLPSLVENAIKHGLEPQREGGEVRIGAAVSGDRLRVVVADTGGGFAEPPGTGVGLANVRERLAALYGDAGRLTLEANTPHGVIATLEVPREGPRTHAAPASGAAPGSAPSPSAAPAAGTARRTLHAIGAAERAWRKGLSFTFVVLVGVAAVVAGLGIVGVATGVFPVQVGTERVAGATGALLGTAGFAIAFAAIVLAIAIVLAVVYGLGFLIAGLALFIPLVILVSVFPALAPFVLVGLGVWWLVRRRRTARERAPDRPAGS